MKLKISDDSRWFIGYYSKSSTAIIWRGIDYQVYHVPRTKKGLKKADVGNFTVVFSF